MAYDVTGCKIQVLENLVFPVQALYLTKNKHIAKPQIDVFTNEVTITDGDVTLKGTVEAGKITVTGLDLTGTGSGGFYDTLKEVLKLSTGKFAARVVWEGGDDITRLVATNGVVEEEQL